MSTFDEINKSPPESEVLNEQISLTKLVQMMNNKNPAIRLQALEHFLQQENFLTNRQFVINFLKDPDLEIAKKILDLVVEKAPGFYGSILRELSAKHKNYLIRGSCLRALIAMKAIKNAELFIQRIPYEKGDIKKELIDATIAFVKEEPQSMTKHIIKTFTSEEPEIRKVGLNMFVNLPNRVEAMQIFYKFCLSIPPFMRDQFIQEVVTEKDSFVELVLLNFKNERDSNIRYLNLKLAKLLKHEKLAQMFLYELNNDDWLVRYVAMLALGEMKCKEAVPALLKAIGDVNVGIAAIKALGDFEDAQLAAEMFKRFPSSSKSEQLEVLKIIQRICDKRFIEPLTTILKKETLPLKVRLNLEECIVVLCRKHKEEVPYAVEQSRSKKNFAKGEGEESADLALSPEEYN